jgi:hypothetical protein
MCQNCGIAARDLPPGHKLKKCGGCKVFHYCSRDCQAKHWPQHKPLCEKASATARHLSSYVVGLFALVVLVTHVLAHLRAVGHPGRTHAPVESKQCVRIPRWWWVCLKNEPDPLTGFGDEGVALPQ